MSFGNIFDSGGSQAKSAEASAKKVSENIPGARPEDKGVDPELYDGIPEAARDPKIVRETAPEALNIMNSFLTPLFNKTQTTAAEQRAASENPASTSDMASSTKDEAFKNVKVEIKDEDRQKIDEKDRPKVSRPEASVEKKA